MVNKIESIPDYVAHSHYRDIGVPIVTLVRYYDLDDNSFGWKWKVTIYTENDDLKSWQDQFPWYEVPFSNYEFGLTEKEMNELVRQMRDYYDYIPHPMCSNISKFEQLLFDMDGNNNPDIKFAAGTTSMKLGKWKARKILSNDALSNKAADDLLLENLKKKNFDAAAKMIIFTSEYSMKSGLKQTLRFVVNESDYKQYLILEGDKKDG